MVRETGPYSSTLTSEEAAYLEKLGFVPSSWSASVFLLQGAPDGGMIAITERTPYTYQGRGCAWESRTPLSRGKPVRRVQANDLTALVVMAKLEGIL